MVRDANIALDRRHFLARTAGIFVGIGAFSASASRGGETGFENIAPQPYFAAIKRAIESLARVGAPVSITDTQRILTLALRNVHAAVKMAEAILARYTVADVLINADGYAYASSGGAHRTLIEQGWRAFLIRISNPVASTDQLQLFGPKAPAS